MASLTSFAIILAVVGLSACQQFHLLPPTSSLTPTPGLQTDRNGTIYLSSGSQLHRLNSNLELEETRNLTSEAVNITLSTDGRWLVVCLTDLSCEVYNATNLSAEPVFRRANVIRSPENVALFAAEDSFYVGSLSVNLSGVQQQITLSQYGFTGDVAETGHYSITQDGFERNFYSGFVAGSNSYYFSIDSNPAAYRGIRVLRVCHNSNFSALYELTLGCGGVAPSSNTRISGVALVEDFAGVSGMTIVLTRSRPSTSHSQNYVCLYSLERINDEMQRKYNSCSTATAGSMEQIALAWRNPTLHSPCSAFQV